jgi:hypothetical protein
MFPPSHLPLHPTDNLVQSEKDPVALATKLRAAWDSIHAAGLGAELELLMEAAVDQERMSVAEDEAGEL